MSSSSTVKVCFNSNCKQVLERSRKGWRRRTGEFADLCERCASAYEDGKFCDAFHLSASGWRCCESCGKQIHCGCIVSFHTFVLLDAGGIECIQCARKSFILTPNPAWPPPSLFLPLQNDRTKHRSGKSWSSVAGSGPVPWHQAPSLFNSSSVQFERQSRTPYEVGLSRSLDRLPLNETLPAFSLVKRRNEDFLGRSLNGTMKIGSTILENGSDVLKVEEKLEPSVSCSQQSSFMKDLSARSFSSILASVTKTDINDDIPVARTSEQRQTPAPPVGKPACSHFVTDSSIEAQLNDGQIKGEDRARNQPFPRYWPRITGQELQQITRDSNSVITPLFEKMLSASDAGRIGRLVLPKKCAEAYFPPISHPEGLPLRVQDLKGKEWIFQFRFWPNNNSRMYVLEGITPCIQSMQLQAGDIVTFSRIEPEGKLVMGFRKASSSASPSDKGHEASAGNGISNCDARATKTAKAIATTLKRKDHSGRQMKEKLKAKPSELIKRKNVTKGSKNKRLRVREDMIEVKVTFKQVQALIRPPSKNVSGTILIEGCEFEEYEGEPIIGRPTIPVTNSGDEIQWVQCEDCFKWRKIPSDALLPSRWTCSNNLWDTQRSLCTAVEELTAEKLEELLATSEKAASKKMKGALLDTGTVEALEGLDKLANLAIHDEGEALQPSSPTTTRHPRHKPGCSCIVCIQPPSRSSKHKESCSCNACDTVRRRFRTMMSNREKRQSEKAAVLISQMLKTQNLPECIPDADVHVHTDTANGSPDAEILSSETFNGLDETTPCSLPCKGQIDLNIKPERDEELITGSNSGGMLHLQDIPWRDIKQHIFSSCIGDGNLNAGRAQQDGIGIVNISKSIALNSTFPGSKADH